ncbi:aldehyde oxidase GLOX1-like protein, partial [Tanacetum coccineum]
MRCTVGGSSDCWEGRSDWEPWEASSWEPWGFPIGAWCGFDVPSQGLKKGNSVGGYRSLRRAVMGSISPNSMFTNVLYPTELSLEAFSPSYLDSGSSSLRPRIISPKTKTKIHFDKRVAITFTVTGAVDPNGVSVTMVSPAFNTHSFSMNQRLLVLDSGNSTRSVEKSTYKIGVMAPPSGNIAPAGNYLLFVVHKEIPSP